MSAAKCGLAGQDHRLILAAGPSLQRCAANHARASRSSPRCRRAAHRRRVAQLVVQLVQQFHADAATVAALARRARPASRGSGSRAAPGRHPRPSGRTPRLATPRSGCVARPSTRTDEDAAGSRLPVREAQVQGRKAELAAELAAMHHMAADGVRPAEQRRTPAPCRRRPAPRAPPNCTRAARAPRSCSCAPRRSRARRRPRRASRSRRRAARRSGSRRRPARTALQPVDQHLLDEVLGRQRRQALRRSAAPPPGRCRSARARRACRAASRCAPAPARAGRPEPAK